MTSSSATDEGAVPIVRIVRGETTPEETAAVLAVVGAAVQEAEAARSPIVEPPGPDAWQRSQRALRTPLRPGPGAWRTSALG